MIVAFAWFLPPALRIPIAMPIFMPGFLVPLLLQHRLLIDDHGLSVMVARRVQWSIAWADLQSVTYEPGSPLSKNWDRLVLRTASGVKNLTLNDRLSGRWDDPARILTLLRSRGYTV